VQQKNQRSVKVWIGIFLRFGIYNKRSIRALSFCRQYARVSQAVRRLTFGLSFPAQVSYNVIFYFCLLGVALDWKCGKTHGNCSIVPSIGARSALQATANNTYNSVLPFPKDKIAYFYSSTISYLKNPVGFPRPKS
jgi:hypothetical protein